MNRCSVSNVSSAFHVDIFVTRRAHATASRLRFGRSQNGAKFLTVDTNSAISFERELGVVETL